MLREQASMMSLVGKPVLIGVLPMSLTSISECIGILVQLTLAPDESWRQVAQSVIDCNLWYSHVFLLWWSGTVNVIMWFLHSGAAVVLSVPWRLHNRDPKKSRYQCMFKECGILSCVKSTPSRQRASIR